MQDKEYLCASFRFQSRVRSSYIYAIDTNSLVALRATKLLLTPTQSRDYIKTHGSESRGQEEAACMRVFWPTRPLQ